MTIELTRDEKHELKNIVANNISFGAFTGMVYNASLEHPTKSIEELTQKALQIKVIVRGMCKEEVPKVPLTIHKQ